MNSIMWNLIQFNNKIALQDEFGRSVTYLELYHQCVDIYKKIEKRCTVLVFCRNTIGSVEGYVSFINNGIVPIMISASLDTDLSKSIIEKYLPRYIWAPLDIVDKYSDYAVIYECEDYCLAEKTEIICSNLHDELALLLTTSGSTGSPKFVRQSYCNIKENSESIIEYLGLSSDEKAITTLPMNYTYGLSIINTHLLVGATVLLTDRSLMQKEFWDFFKESKATSFGGVPYTYEILDRLKFYRMELPSLRYMTQAGGKISEELHKKIAEYALNNEKKFIVMYGQCEATARMGYLPADKALEKCGSMGIAIPGGQFRLVDSYGNVICEPHVMGELVYEGKNVSMGYAENIDDLSKGDERNGVLYTGDMAEIDEEGYYYIVGRKKRFLKIYGNRVNLDEIDKMIQGYFDNVEVVSAGVDDHIFIFITDVSISDEIKAYVVQKTNLNPKAFRVVVLNQIPKNDSGKTMYKDLEKYYEW